MHWNALGIVLNSLNSLLYMGFVSFVDESEKLKHSGVKYEIKSIPNLVDFSIKPKELAGGIYTRVRYFFYNSLNSKRTHPVLILL